MKNTLLTTVLTVLSFIAAAALVHADGTHPQGIRLDGTVGVAGMLDLPGPDYEILAEYGHQAGSNLFHSFQQFNIHSGESATFRGPASVQNIISRVTGGSSSWIDGTLGSDIRGANLYLLNPAGIMFGPNASLDMTGSFHAGTADYLRMGENERFFTAPSENELLSAAAPTAFGFLDNNAAPVTVEGMGELTQEVWGQEYGNWEDWLEDNNPDFFSGLAVAEGETISLIGGDIEITKGTRAPYEDEYENPFTSVGTTLSAPGGRIILAGVAAPGEVIPGESVPDVSSVETLGNIRITDRSVMDVSGEGGGSVFIRAGRFELAQSVITSYTRGEQDGGIIDARADDISVENSEISVDTESFGNGADIALKAGGTLTVSNSVIYGDTYGEEPGSGRAGNIEMEAGQVTLTDGSYIYSTTYGSGESGNISLKADDTLTLSGWDADGYVTTVYNDSGDYETPAVGRAGRIDLEAGQINLTDGAYISSTAYGSGQSGHISVKAGDTLTLSGQDSEGCGRGCGTTISNNSGNSETAAEANAGQIDLEAPRIIMSDNAEIQTITYGSGNSGTVAVKAADVLALSNGSGIYSNSEAPRDGDGNPVYTETGGNAGYIMIEAGQVTMEDTSQISSTTFTSGEGGVIDIRVSDALTLSGPTDRVNPGGIFANSEKREGDAGNAGQIKIKAGRLTITEDEQAGLQISSTTFGTGESGVIDISVSDTLTISGKETGIFNRSKTEDPEAGSGGTIYVSAQTVVLENQGKISTSTVGGGNAGDIYLDVGRLRMDSESSVSSASYNEQSGAAGMITVTADDSIHLAGGSSLNTEAADTKVLEETEDRKNGRITVNAGNLLHLSDSRIATSVKGGLGNGGDMDIRISNADTANSGFVILNNSQIRANAYEGQGGNIHVVSDQFIQSSDSIMSASSQLGIDGSIEIEAPDEDATSGLAVLPESYLDVSRWMKKPCAAKSGGNMSSFVIKGRDALASVFDDWLPSPAVWLDDSPYSEDRQSWNK
ncbi:MAG: filamentous hemagglutinin N-terminal domain-containing protein [Desulfobacterales bacterium]|nr:filamentous hemagglutinin N-terminal domain-containing protein [Desulfobacterales bacterium]